MRISPKYIQAFGDLIIPLAGFFFWGWNLHFILLFYFIDIVTSEILMQVKSKKIVEEQGRGKSAWVKFATGSAVLLVAIIVISHLAMAKIIPGIGFAEALKNFWTYEEMGIQQGYVLVPLVAFAGYQQYKLFFLRTRRYERMEISVLWRPHLRAYYIILGGAGLSFGVSLLVSIPEVVYVLLLVLLSTAYQFKGRN